MTDTIFLLNPDRTLVEASSQPYDLEAELQELLAENVQLLPGAQIDRENPRRWQLIKREAGIPNRDGGGGWWSVDHLIVDQDAIPTFVEVKRATDTRNTREVVAQMLDYAANGTEYWKVETLRGWYEGDDADRASERLSAWLQRDGENADAVADEFWADVAANLRDGQVRLIFVADDIPPTLQRLVEFLNEQLKRVEVLAVEIRQYKTGTDARGALVPRVIGQTSRAQATKERVTASPRRTTRWTMDQVLESVGDAGEQAARTVLDWAVKNERVTITGGVGLHSPSCTIAVDMGIKRSRQVGVLSLYGSSDGASPVLEVRLKRMARYLRRRELRVRLLADLNTLRIPRLVGDDTLLQERPSIPLDQLTDGRVERLLALVDRWITEERAMAEARVNAGEGGDDEEPEPQVD